MEIKQCRFEESDIQFIDGDRGSNYPSKADFMSKGYCVFLNTGNVTPNGFDFSNIDFISKEKDEALRKGKVNINDIILTTRGTVGNSAFMSEDIPFKNIRINSGMVIVRANKEKIDPYFLYSFFRSELFKKQCGSNGSGSAQPQLPISALKNIAFPNFDLPTQQKIAKILTALDRKIALNNQINAELEKMAKTLYEYWFVQFDFPDENGKPYKSSGGKMIWNEVLKREVPLGWEVWSLSELCEFKNGVNYEKGENGDTLAKIINVRDVSNSSIFIINNELDEISLEHSKMEKYLADENTILITRSGNPGAIRLVIEEENLIYCGFIIGCKLNKKENYLPVFYTLKNVEELMKDKSAGTILKNISQDTLKDLQIALPKNDKISEEFNQKVIAYFSLIKKNLKQTQTLTQYRNFLLPMLMNGQVEIL